MVYSGALCRVVVWCVVFWCDVLPFFAVLYLFFTLCFALVLFLYYFGLAAGTGGLAGPTMLAALAGLGWLGWLGGIGFLGWLG